MRKRPGIIRRAFAGLVRAAASAATWTADTVLATSKNYDALDPSRKLIDRAIYQSKQQANEVLNGGLRSLQYHCRHLERNNPTARAIIEGLTGLVVCTGISLEPNTGDPAIDDLVKAEWEKYIRHCAVDGRSLYELQDLGFREVVTVGESLWIDQIDPDLAAAGEIPLRILPLDSEWLEDSASSAPKDGITCANGLAIDSMGRTVGAYLANPSATKGKTTFFVPSERLNHCFEARRALQSRGEPWMAPVIETLILERKLVDAEIYAAQQTAALAIAITSEMHDALDTGDEDPDADADDPAQILRPGATVRLYPGESVEALGHTRPSQQIAPFRQMLRGDIAGCMRLPQRFLDRDVSRANYSSMRADMLDTQRLLDPVRQWWGECTAGRIYRKALPWILLKLGVTQQVSDDYKLIPDEVPYVDPQKDIPAALMSIWGGLSDYETEIGKRGGDRRKVWEQRRKEIEEAKGIDIKLPSKVVGTDVDQQSQQGSQQDAQQ